MALYGHGVNYAKSIDPTPESIIDQGLFGGKLRCHQDYFTVNVTSVFTSDDYVAVGKMLPKDSQIVEIVVGSTCPTLDTNSAIRVGIERDNDYFLSTAVHASIGTITANAVRNIVRLASSMYTAVTQKSDEYVRIYAGGKTESLTTGTVKVSIFYVAGE